MVKTIILSSLFLLISLCSYSNIQSNNSDDNCVTYECKAEFAVDIATSFEGIKEVGNNRGFNNKTFERLMINVGWYPGAPWCAFALSLVYKLAGLVTPITGFSPSAYNKKHVIFDNGVLKESIKPGDAGTLSYNKYKRDRRRYKGIGHAFLIKSMYGKSAVVTSEGNTDSDASREGNGFYQKIRPLQSNLHITRWDK
jgi:hypothetical protein